jgi:hypothetical protein
MTMDLCRIKHSRELGVRTERANNLNFALPLTQPSWLISVNPLDGIGGGVGIG